MRIISRREFLTGATASIASGCNIFHAKRTISAKPLVLSSIDYDAMGGLFIEGRVSYDSLKWFILDTGASRSALSALYAKTLGLEIRASNEDIEGSAGIIKAAESVAMLEIPGLAPLQIDFSVYDLQSYHSECVGILGYECLYRMPFQIKYRQRSLIWNAPPPTRQVQMVLDGKIPRTTVRINGKSIDLRIDTGAALSPSREAYVNLAPSQAELIGISGPPLKIFKATGTGSAILQLKVYPLSDLCLGGLRLANAFAIVQPNVGYFARKDAVGFLGNSILDKIDPFFDYANGIFGF